MSAPLNQSSGFDEHQILANSRKLVKKHVNYGILRQSVTKWQKYSKFNKKNLEY